MESKRLTNGLLAVIAFALLAHLILALGDRGVIAETFQLDNCITSRTGDKPTAYLHVVSHGTSEPDSH